LPDIGSFKNYNIIKSHRLLERRIVFIMLRLQVAEKDSGDLEIYLTVFEVVT